MKKIQALVVVLTFTIMCFSGCLENNSKNKTNNAPEAYILMPSQASTVTAGEPFQIDGSSSIDPDGDDLEYMWTLSGLGSPIDLSTKVADTVTISTPGKDLILTLKVRDTQGLTGEDFIVINAEPGNRPPKATITSPSNGGAYSRGNVITFNGMASSDPDNDVLSYSWELGEDGGPSYTADQSEKFVMELDEGQWSITLTVEDPDGETNSVTHSFSVTDLPPIASITSNSNSAFTGENIEFSGEKSYDPEGTALAFLWDFGDNKTASLRAPEHNWNEPGTYVVTLTVEDGAEQKGTATKTIEIKSLGPSAVFTFKDDGSSVEKIRANTNITLDGSESTAPEGEIKEYRWNFGNGNETTNESTVEHSWPSGGYYDVTLVVVDGNDETGEITKILQVVPEDYSDEGQDGTVVLQNSNNNDYNMSIEIFVKTFKIEFTDISCSGIGGDIDYIISVQDSKDNEIGTDTGPHNVACGGDNSDSWTQTFYVEDNPLELGNYNVNISFTNNGLVATNISWNYFFEIIYDF